MITALILTYNEENILGKCLEALHFVDEILVFDSYSTDNTLSIAKSFNARIEQRVFDNYASQRNAGLNAVSENIDWILMIDADEIVTSELKEEVLSVVNSKTDTALFRVRRKDMFNNKWMRHSTGYPTWFPRLFKNGCVTVEREINEEYVTDGKISNLKSHLIHFPFNKGMSWWFQKHNVYSDMEAKKMIHEISEPLDYRLLFSKDPVLRRKFIKRLSYRMPFRPHFVFFLFFVLKKGFLDGSAGYTYCKMRRVYESMIDVKFKLLKNNYIRTL